MNYAETFNRPTEALDELEEFTKKNLLSPQRGVIRNHFFVIHDDTFHYPFAFSVHRVPMTKMTISAKVISCASPRRKYLFYFRSYHNMEPIDFYWSSAEDSDPDSFFFLPIPFRGGESFLGGIHFEWTHFTAFWSICVTG